MDVEFGGRKFILNIELKLAVKSQILLTYKYFMQIFIAKYVNISDPQKIDVNISILLCPCRRKLLFVYEI